MSGLARNDHELSVMRSVWRLYRSLDLVPPPEAVCWWWATRQEQLLALVEDALEALRNEDGELLVQTLLVLLQQEVNALSQPWVRVEEVSL